MDLHPFFVHFPVSLFFLALFLEILNSKIKWIHENVSILIFVLATIFTIPASITGDSAEYEAGKIIGIFDTLSTHENMGTILTISGILFSFLFVILQLKFPQKSIKKLKIAVFLLFTLMVFYTGFLGARLVKEFGAGVKLTVEQKNKF